jgi:hypothetical protein
MGWPQAKKSKGSPPLMRQAAGFQGKTIAFLFGLQGVSIIFACLNDHYLNNLWSGWPAR